MAKSAVRRKGSRAAAVESAKRMHEADAILQKAPAEQKDTKTRQRRRPGSSKGGLKVHGDKLEHAVHEAADRPNTKAKKG